MDILNHRKRELRTSFVYHASCWVLPVQKKRGLAPPLMLLMFFPLNVFAFGILVPFTYRDNATSVIFALAASSFCVSPCRFMHSRNR